MEQMQQFQGSYKFIQKLKSELLKLLVPFVQYLHCSFVP